MNTENNDILIIADKKYKVSIESVNGVNKIMCKLINLEPPLKYPNGAEVYAPDVGSVYHYVGENGHIEWTKFADNYKGLYRLNNQNLFLLEETADKASLVKNTHNKLLKKIIEINAGNDWVLNSNKSNGYYLCFSSGKKFGNCYAQSLDIYMSEQAKDYMMANAVTLEEFKQFLFMYD